MQSLEGSFFRSIRNNFISSYQITLLEKHFDSLLVPGKSSDAVVYFTCSFFTDEIRNRNEIPMMILNIFLFIGDTISYKFLKRFVVLNIQCAHFSGWRLSLINGQLSARVRLLALCRDELFVVIVWLMSEFLEAGRSCSQEVKRQCPLSLVVI